MMPKETKQKRANSPKLKHTVSKGILMQSILLETAKSKMLKEGSAPTPPMLTTDGDDDWPILSAATATPVDMQGPVPDPTTQHMDLTQVQPSVLSTEEGSNLEHSSLLNLKKQAVSTVAPIASTTPWASVGFASVNIVMGYGRLSGRRYGNYWEKLFCPCVFSNTSIQKKILIFECLPSGGSKVKGSHHCWQLET
jgi:hypothetical protein